MQSPKTVLLCQVAGAARDGFMATVGHLLNRRGSAKVDDVDIAAAAARSPALQLDADPAVDSDMGTMLSAGSVDLAAILRTCAQPLSPETLAYLRASGPPRSFLHDDDDDGSESPATTSAFATPRVAEAATAAPGGVLSPASGTDSNGQPSPAQLQLDVQAPGGPERGGRQALLESQDGGRRSTELSWDGAGLHPLDGDNSSPFDMLLSAPEEIAGMFLGQQEIATADKALIGMHGPPACTGMSRRIQRGAGDEDGSLAFMDSIAAAAAEPRSYAVAESPWSFLVRDNDAADS